MPFKNLPYGLSHKAEHDLEEIFDYTFTEFGIHDAVYYTKSLAHLIERLPTNPKMEKERKEIRDGLYSSEHGKHIIFYRILPKCIWIVRILHGKQDMPPCFLF